MREVMLILHLIGLSMGVGTSFAFMFLGIAASRMEKEEGLKFTMSTLPLGTMGHIGITLLIVSGGYLMTPYWGVLTMQPVLMAKLALVLLLTVFMIMGGLASKKAKQGDLSQLKKTARLGPVMLLTSIVIVILAVIVFR